MNRLAPLESSRICGWSWEATDGDAGTLTLQFVSDGSTWHYAAVPRSVLERFLLAPSKGAFFHAAIRDKYAAMPAVSSFDRILDAVALKGLDKSLTRG